jgi:DNA segregation ATPase FtsK/SpoIIIE, S-DNA-T family
MTRKPASKPAAGHSRAKSGGKSAPAGGRKSTRAPKIPRVGVLDAVGVRKWRWNKLSIDRKLDILGVIMALIGFLTLLSLISSQNGVLTGWWVLFVERLAGYGSFILPAALILVGIWLVLRNVERLPMLSMERITGVILLYFNILAVLHLIYVAGEASLAQIPGHPWMGWDDGQIAWALAEAGQGGGYFGAGFERLLVGALGRPGAVVALAAWALIAVALTFDISVSEIFHFVQKILASLARRVNRRLASERALHVSRQQAMGQLEQHPVSELPSDFTPLGKPAVAGAAPAAASSGASPSSARRTPTPLEEAVAAEGRSGSAPTPTNPHRPMDGAARSRPAAPAVIHKETSLPPWKTPEISEILDPATVEVAKNNLDFERGKVIEETLASFGAPVKVVETQRGPTVTQFGVEPLYVENRSGRTRVRVSKIVALADDLALALAASRIRIQAPVPGRNFVGIEVPNMEVSRVMLRDVMESESYRKLKSPMRFALGKDVSGHSRSYDLAAMPHLLIAGTTGSGKSVLVNSLLTCMLINNSPNELRMILVDPKRVELTGYNGIPHLLAPVVVEAEQVVGALQWVQREMDARYHRFSQTGARNIVDYNSRNSPPLPYMLVLIDELADLMMLAPDETERSLARLAQLARATGIHLVLATQRPSVDVVTGLIKANFPARVAFAVASGIDSRVILDQPGAERLLGRGDMLFQAPDAAAPVRLQGVWVADPEIQRLVEYWRQQAYDMRDHNHHAAPTAVPVNMELAPNTPLKQTPLWGDSEEKSGGDPITPEAIKIVREERKASISMLQRRLRIGYTRSARLIEQLEEMGIIGPALATSQVREVLDYGEPKNAEAEDSVS